MRAVTASLLDRAGLHYFTLYATLNGVMQGAFTLGNVVLKKTLNADELAIGVVSALSVVSLLIGIFGSELVVGRDKRPFIFWLGLLSRGSFLLFFFCRDVVSFIAVSAVFFFLNALLMPAVYSMWQANVSAVARSRLWGLTITAATLISMAATYVAGRLLDHDEWAYTWLLPAGGLLGILSILILAQSPLRGKYKLENAPVAINIRQVVIQPIVSFFELLKRDRQFFHFEVAFFFYGMALMLLFPVMPHFMVDAAQMNYEQAGIASGILSQVGIVALSPLWGRLMDRSGPVQLCMIIFAILATFPAILLLGLHITQSVPLYLVVYGGYLVFGCAMAGISVAWSLGPVHFAGSADASGYSGAHVTITGIRGAFAPIAGAIGLKYLGFEPVFIASALLFLIGSAGMLLITRRQRRGYYSVAQ
jgi:MFS family permease